MQKQDKYTTEEYRAITNGPLGKPGASADRQRVRIQENVNRLAGKTAPAKKNKYGARRTEYNGNTYDSKLEAKHAESLDFQLRAGVIKSYKRQMTFDLSVNEQIITRYKADFFVINLDGSWEVHECKGYRVRDFAMRKKLFEALHPRIKIKIFTK
jgi:hypothetical protein